MGKFALSASYPLEKKIRGKSYAEKRRFYLPFSCPLLFLVVTQLGKETNNVGHFS